jgi:hypothetical protein
MRRRGHGHRDQVRPMTWWEWLIVTTIAPMPAFAVWRWRVRKAQERVVAEIVAYHRERFGGAIKLPGQRKALPVERPEPMRDERR